MYFCYFVINSPWKKAGPFIWTNLNRFHPWMHCATFGCNWLSGSGEENFLILSIYFRYFVIISHWKRSGPFIWTNLNPLYLRMLCAKFGWNWPSGSGEEDENVKSLRQRRWTTDKYWSEKLTCAFGSGELKRHWQVSFPFPFWNLLRALIRLLMIGARESNLLLHVCIHICLVHVPFALKKLYKTY